MDVTGSATTNGRAGRREWIGLGVLALPTILSAMDFGVLYLLVRDVRKFRRSLRI